MLKQKQVASVETNLHSPINLDNKLDGINDKCLIGITFTGQGTKTSVFVSPRVTSYDVMIGGDAFTMVYQEGTITFNTSDYRVSDIILYNDAIAEYTGESIVMNNQVPFVITINDDGKIHEINNQTDNHYTVNNDSLTLVLGEEVIETLVF